MSDKVLIDTNIFIYALDADSVHHAASLRFLQEAEALLFTTSKNLSEYFAVCTKLNLERDKVLGFYDAIKRNTVLLFPDAQSLRLFEELFERYYPRGNRVHDLEIVSIMLANGLKKIATVNKDDFKNIVEVEIVDL